MNDELLKIKEEIKNGNLSQAINNLNKIRLAINETDRNEIIQITARLNELEKQERNGTISFEFYNTEKNKIRTSLLKIINHFGGITFQDKQMKEIKKWKYLNIGILFVLVVSLLFNFTSLNSVKDMIWINQSKKKYFFEGDWKLNAREIGDSNKFVSLFTYDADLNFRVDDGKVLMTGIYRVTNDSNYVSPRKINGTGDLQLDGEYIRIMYEITSIDNQGKGFGLLMIKFHNSGKTGTLTFNSRGMEGVRSIIIGEGDLFR